MPAASPRSYFLVFAILLVLTLTTVVVAAHLTLT